MSAHPDRARRLAEVATLLAHDENLPFDPVVPPIYQTSLFTFRSYRDMEETFSGRARRPVYSRGDNPTVMEFEKRIAQLEGAEASRAFSSGMGAISATVLALLRAGDRVLAVRHVYSDTFRLFQRLLPKFGIAVDYVDGTDAEAVIRGLSTARMLFLESPTSMVFELQDLPKLAAAARAHGVVTVLDNSWATPVFQQPLLHGVDLVLHSASKYIGGHSDTVAGVVSGSAALIQQINQTTYSMFGAKLSPFEAWLLLRGLRTLTLRLPRHEASALVIADRLRQHPMVSRIHHPAFSNHPGRETLLGSTGLFSFEVDERVDVPRFIDALQLFRIGVSWGGHESLVVPAMASLHQTPDYNALARFSVSPRLIRLHVGLEDVESLWSDLERALTQETL
ncbi:MAG TPA: aminotransferase class I/II-fold pyridoxal phosphate-dependent enzyme [Acidisoma sp.]|uniref:aminotransferase class I/II-fold pyridoxal phosphate-dependent enzyme n=1 Tax=Acidisoma sp. TaxID=1872115 RepID=UPI002C619BF4|nr:aminotransferase class I/II-fold pyridoxal phosphate-dependent enzyme [Acidisoma sp.]HTI00919.1 aminotransferase class I/II-fold pyridoxal phosphate-dependent enzyme [Acidisoma sp.]